MGIPGREEEEEEELFQCKKAKNGYKIQNSLIYTHTVLVSTYYFTIIIAGK